MLDFGVFRFLGKRDLAAQKRRNCCHKELFHKKGKLEMGEKNNFAEQKWGISRGIEVPEQ
jgi:hypothetical protein